MPEADVVLEAREISLSSDAATFSEKICRQEIIGLAGLDGHGQAKFLEYLAGVQLPASGQVLTHGDNGTHEIRSLADAARNKVGYLPSDRKRNGIFPELSVANNFALGNLSGYAKFGWFSKAVAKRSLNEFQQALSISYASPGMPVNRLSGGNQQKVLLARAMSRNPSIMLLNDPTRGVDIQTRHALYEYFRQAVSEAGLTLVVLSTELEEILELCHRVIVFRDNGISARMDKSEMSMDSLMAAMFGQKEGQRV